jgi:phenol 2-monooxygenase
MQRSRRNIKAEASKPKGQHMQFHHFGYVSGNPRIQRAAGVGVDRPAELPEEVDVLIVGAGPAGMITAAQLSQFPNVTTRIIERRDGRLEVGQADGIQARSVETFQAFGFADRIIDEAYRITMMAFWKPDPNDPSRIIRTATPTDDPSGVSEFPHLLVNQARVQDYFAEFMANAPTRMTPDYGYEFLGLRITEDDDHPVAVTVRGGDATGASERIIRARYVVGCDGAKSAVRESIGLRLEGDQALHAWGVMDVLALTNFPDIRMKCAIQSHDGGNILLIPREGGYLFRMYVDLGEVSADDKGAVRATTIEQIIAKANQILFPYTLDVKSVVWHSVYEVGHRLTERFDNVRAGDVGSTTPRVFIAGDACHTHSAKAGQGMNVSMQDGFNLGWKLGHVLDGRSPDNLLDTYSSERHVIAGNLIAFDKQWSTLMATRQEELEDPSELEDFYVKTFEFPAGFMTQYQPSMLTAEPTHQDLASGYPIGKRFKSAPVIRVCDANPLHLGHQAAADGRWRIYAFADAAAQTGPPSLSAFADWITNDPNSPISHTPAELDADSWFDIKVIYQQQRTDVELGSVPDAFLPHTGPFELIDYNNVFAADPVEDIFELRGIDRGGVVVVVRPDQYVATVIPLAATAELAAFFRSVLVPRDHDRRS